VQKYRVVIEIVQGSVGCFTQFVAHVVDVPITEAYALKEGLLLAQHIGVNWLIIQAPSRLHGSCRDNEGRRLFGELGGTHLRQTQHYAERISGHLISIEHCSMYVNRVAQSWQGKLCKSR
jgi:hypothetical protein